MPRPNPADSRIYVILARDSPLAVIFRRGPSKHVLLLTWDTSNDEIEEGQWLKGRIYERRGDLSPDGELLIYFAANQRKPFYSWTAISRPPYLTALALWPKGDGWGGGGHFKSRSEVLLNHRENEMTLAEGFSTPKWLKVRPFGDRPGWGEDHPVWAERLSRDGWVCVSEGRMAKRDHGARVWIEFDPPVIWEKSHPRWPHQYMLQMKITGLKERDGPWYVCEHVLLDHASGDVHALGRSDWADWAHSGDLLYAKDGAIYRVRCGSKALAAIGDAACVIDLSDRVFRERKAQAGRLQWPGRSRS